MYIFLIHVWLSAKLLICKLSIYIPSKIISCTDIYTILGNYRLGNTVQPPCHYLVVASLSSSHLRFPYTDSSILLSILPPQMTCLSSATVYFFKPLHALFSIHETILIPSLSGKSLLGTSLVMQWLRRRAPNTGGVGSIPGQGMRSHMHATTKEPSCCN